MHHLTWGSLFIFHMNFNLGWLFYTYFHNDWYFEFNLTFTVGGNGNCRKKWSMFKVMFWAFLVSTESIFFRLVQHGLIYFFIFFVFTPFFLLTIWKGNGRRKRLFKLLIFFLFFISSIICWQLTIIWIVIVTHLSWKFNYLNLGESNTSLMLFYFSFMLKCELVYFPCFLWELSYPEH